MRPGSVLLILVIGLAASVAAASAEAGAFVHKADVTNTVGYWTLLEHPSLVDLNTVPVVTQNWNPGGVGGTYNDHPIAVYFDIGGSEQWLIFNLDEADIPLGASFNVLVVDLNAESSYLHEALDSNTSGPITELAHPMLADNSGAVALVNQLQPFVPDAHPIGLLWAAPTGPPFAWYIGNLDGVAMPYGMEGFPPVPGIPGPLFHVFAARSSQSAFRHEATLSNIINNWTVIDSPLLNGNPDALVFVTGVAFSALGPPHELGVWYDGSRWAIFYEDEVTMVPGATFNVVVVDPIFDDGFESGNTSAWSGALP